MTNLVIKAGLAIMVAATGLSASFTGAAAAGPDGFMTVQWDGRGGPPPWDDRRGPPPRWDGGRRDMCAPGFAEEKASRMGLRRAHVIDVNRRVVVVEGFSRRGPDRIVFANERGCPLMRR